MKFTEFHVDWMSPEEVYLHRESTSSQLYRGISASLGFRKPVGKLLCTSSNFCLILISIKVLFTANLLFFWGESGGWENGFFLLNQKRIISRKQDIYRCWQWAEVWASYTFSMYLKPHMEFFGSLWYWKPFQFFDINAAPSLNYGIF